METAKKFTYVTLFGLLGFFTQLIVHAVGEIGYIVLLVHDFGRWSFGLGWDGLLVAHAVWTYGLIILGVGIGIWQGMYWWRRVYIEKCRGTECL